jgi:protein-tyrosine-phosphatase
MAEGLFRKLLEESPISGIQVTSAGLLALPGNQASDNAVRVALDHGISLENHEARLLRPSMVQQADLLVVMEPLHRAELLRRYPEATQKVLLLRHFARFGSRERPIQDPYGLSLETYRFCFEDIKECVESLHQWLAAS